MARFSTSNRIYFLTLQEYGEDDLLIEDLSGEEALSRTFEFRLKLLSHRDDIEPAKIIGKKAVLRIETHDTRHMGGERHWNGYVSRFLRTGRLASGERDGEIFYTYECDIVPWFWFMAMNEDNRIFQNLAVDEIVDAIFAEFGYSDYKFELDPHRDHPKLPYCTQYGESTFAFISRLCEREGIYYYFRHNERSESLHTLVFTDYNGKNPKLEPDRIPFHHEGQSGDYDAIHTLWRDEQMRTRQISLADWNYEKKNHVKSDVPTTLEIGKDHGLERFRYPGGFTDAGYAKLLTETVMEAEEADHLRFHGTSQVRTMAPGHVFTLYDHPVYEDLEQKYLIVSVRHFGSNNLVGEGGGAHYGNEFSLIPHDLTFRPPLSTPPARVRGPQTAIVVGPQGEEIYTDKLGRVKVRFHWDRKVSGRPTWYPDDKATCWVRVAQVWAGNGYGTMFIPRIGMEVLVDFLEGDPDQPIVVGCVYNGVNMPPYELPANATRSTLKTLTSKGGGGYNELRFEDKKNNEEIFLHAQKDLQVEVEHDAIVRIKNESHLIVEKDHFQKLLGESHTVYEQATKVAAKREWHFGGVHAMHFGGKMDIHLDAGMNFNQTAGINMNLKAGAILNIEAAATINLKAGGSFLSIGPSGVTMQGAMVMINSGGAAGSAQSATKPQQAKEPKQATTDKPGAVTEPIQQLQAEALKNAAAAGQPFCAECEAARKALEALRIGR